MMRTMCITRYLRLAYIWAHHTQLYGTLLLRYELDDLGKFVVGPVLSASVYVKNYS